MCSSGNSFIEHKDLLLSDLAVDSHTHTSYNIVKVKLSKN